MIKFTDGYTNSDCVKPKRKITDTDRLEFLVLSDGHFVVRSNPERSSFVVWDQSNGLCMAGKGTTMREAIDAAMKYKTGE